MGCRKALLTHSCTASLEMAAMLADIQPGDEVILPSFTFVSTANAFVLRGGVPVFVDIRPDTLNIDEKLVEQAITRRTKAIIAVHYAGIACEMAKLSAIAKKHGLFLIEDAAQAVLSTYKGCPLGSIGDLAALSFHETKTLLSGEGGALLVNDPALCERAEILREKGTNRGQFFRGQVDRYTWLDIGSSYLPSDLIAAFLWAQLESARDIVRRRLAIWDRYHGLFAGAERKGLLRRPVVPEGCGHNGHMYHLLLRNLRERERLIAEMKRAGVMLTFHYVPLHSSPAGLRFGRQAGPMTVTDETADRLVRLPLWLGVEPQINRIAKGVLKILERS